VLHAWQERWNSTRNGAAGADRRADASNFALHENAAAIAEAIVHAFAGDEG
jgi:hypothetical protein